MSSGQYRKSSEPAIRSGLVRPHRTARHPLPRPAPLASDRPERQRRGIGRALFSLAEEDFRRRGLVFWLSSTEEINKRSLRFHEALGFRRIGTLFDLGQDAGEIFLRKDLASRRK